MPQSHQWQQSGLSEMPILQQQFMLKQLQEMQRQQQYQSFADMRQHSAISKNVEGDQFTPLINGTPVHSTSNMFMNYGQHGGSPSLQGMSQLASGQDHRTASDGETIQRYDGPSYDSPVANSGSNSNQIYLQGNPSEHRMQQQQPVAQTLSFTHSFSGGQNSDSSKQAFAPTQDYSRSNAYGQVHQKFNEDNSFRSFEPASILPKNSMAYATNESEQGRWLNNQLDNKLMHITPPQGSATLDPLEEKVLFSMDDNLWEISCGKSTEIGTGNAGNGLGSWSALMQSALAETSSSETGMQEEWGGLTFQNTDPLADNQTSNFVDNNLQHSSGLSATEYQYLNSSGVHFPGFHQPAMNGQSEQDRLLHSSNEHNRQFSKTGSRLENNHQQSSTVGMPQSQMMTQTKHGWAIPNYAHGENYPTQLQRSSVEHLSNNADFWNASKAQAMNNFSSGPDSRNPLGSVATQNQENQLAYSYQMNTGDALRDNVRMVNQHVSNGNPRALDGSYMQLNSNAMEQSSQGRSENKLNNALDNSMIFQASSPGPHGSPNVLHLFQNNNQSRVESSLVQESSISQGPKIMGAAASESQYHNQSTAQGSISLPSPSSQRFPNHMHSSQNSWQKIPTSVTPSVPHQSQIQWQQISRSAVESQPIQTELYSAATRYANASASPHQNSPGSTYANPFTQQYTGFRAQSPSTVSGSSPQDAFPSTPVNQWTAVPVQNHYAGAKSEKSQGVDLSDKNVDGMIGSPQNLNEQKTVIINSGVPTAKPAQLHTLSEMPDSVIQPASEMQKPMENLGGTSEKNSSLNQMNILYGDQGDTFWSNNAMNDITNQSLATSQPNKRKSPTCELIPWHKEVVKIPVTFPDIRMAEREWAQATNRPMEVIHTDGQSLTRPRKRLILTTQLMQKVLDPAPRVILSKIAASAYESLAYIVARLSLGYACNMSSARVKTDIPSQSGKGENIDVGRVVDNFSKRTKQLEDALGRLDKRLSLVDITVECQELERFAVINRFAKFHSRAQPNPSEPFSSGPPKMYPQRYVSALPMPKDIPDVFQCVSL